MEKYQKISVFVTLSVLTVTAISLFSLSKSKPDLPAKNFSENEIHTSQVENIRKKNSSDKTDSPQSVKSTEGFLLILENNFICAYKSSNGHKTLLEKAPIETSSLSTEELSRLSGGINAESLEEVYLFFESYTS